ncbi:MAG TPA: serine hydrolase domain-containing protein [Leptospiraceae bacterium]|nr:beta-lactamase family protein [Leptospirales bacterium]HMY44967.1 serine hydrolase domain-containing protein [Leptospiraceae bacterium]HNE21926.1 serine hydrolase domain-containing protein [Leptospiraceae bacterium]HNN75084.1 serine hydrolase domain-containing protein [Leptospiraceae bacterium]
MARLGLLLLVLFTHCYTSEEPVRTVRPVHVDEEKIRSLSYDLEAYIQYHIAKGVFYSMTVGVVRGDDLVYSRYINSVPSRLYSVGSITKVFTATAAMRLQEKGIIDFDERLSDVFPGLHVEQEMYHSPAVTLRHLLSHSSGMPDLRYYVPPEMIHHPEIDFPISPQTAPAGVQFRYSNLGYQLLGEAFKKISHRQISDIIDQEVYAAAGMNDSRMLPGSTGAYGVMTNVTDLAKFASVFLRRGLRKDARFLHAQSVDAMLRNQIYAPPAEFQDYNGIGWRVRTDGQGIVQMYHVGGANGVAAWLQIFPRSNVALFYLGDPPKYEEDTMGVLVGIQARLGNLATEFAGETRPLFVFRQSVSPETELPRFAGEYREPASGEVASVLLQGGGIWFQKGISPPYPVVPECRAVFDGGYGNVQHAFILDQKDGHVLGVATNNGYYTKVTR